MRQKSAIAELGIRAIETTDIQTLMDEVTSLVADVLHVEYCGVLELLPDGESLFLRAATGWDHCLVGNLTLCGDTASQAAFTLSADGPVVMTDLETEDRFLPHPCLRERRLVSGISVKLHGKARPWGVLGAHSDRKRDFSSSDLLFVQSVANILAAALERHRTEAARSESEFLLRNVLDSLPVGVWVVDGEGTIIHGNPASQRIWAGAKYVGMEGYGEYKAWWPDTGKPVEAHEWGAARALRTGESVLNDVLDIECFDGTRKTILNSAVPIRSPEGTVTGSIVVNEDITAQRAAQKTLVEQKELLQVILDNIPVMVALFDRETRIAYGNRQWEKTLGWTVEEAREVDIVAELYASSEDRRKVLKFIAGASGEWEQFRTRVRDGRVLDTAWANIALSDGSNIGIGQDITERKRLEEQLAQAQKMEAVGRLAGGVAHDFNNMLSVINGIADLLLHRLPTDDPLRRSLEQIQQAGGRAADLTKQLLAFSRKQVLAPKVLDLGEQIEQIDKMLRRMIGEDIDLVTRRAPGLWKIRADPGQIEQVIFNLSINARDAMPHGGSLFLETRNVEVDGLRSGIPSHVPPGSYVSLTMSDSGIGMDRETLLQIFEPFFTTKEVGKGTGLGLATVFGIVKQSGGYIWAESEPGHGATFTVLLPRTLAEEETVAPEEDAPYPVGRETILLVEDEMMVREIVREVLLECGYSLLEATNGEEAMETLRNYEGRIDLLLTDVVMPGSVGGALLAEQVTRWRPETRVLFMSGYTDDSVIHRGVMTDTLNFIQKPFSPGVLAQRVRTLLNSGNEPPDPALEHRQPATEG